MAIDHFEGPLTAFTWQALGFASAAEGFVLLSGLLAGLVYTRRALTSPERLTRSALRRSARVYGYHLTIVLPLIALGAAVTSYAEYWVSPAPLFGQDPGRALVLAPLLLYLPAYLGILPIYIVMLLCLPALIRGFIAGRLAPILGISVGVWLFAQVNQGGWMHGVEHAIAGADLGYFDLLAWQLLFVCGTAMGFLWQQQRVPAAVAHPAVVGLSAAIALSLFFVRHGWMADLSAAAWLPYATSRAQIGWLRLIDVVALACLIAALLRHAASWRSPRALACLGRHSLQAYAFHVVLLYLLRPVKWRLFEIGRDGQIAATLIFVAMLFVPAILRELTRPPWRTSASA